MKLYCFYTESHEVLFKNWLFPTASIEYNVIQKKGKQYSKTGSYCSLGWRKTQIDKLHYWQQAVRDNMGDLIICCDTDIQFLGRTKFKLINLLKDKDIAFTKNSNKFPICSGFFICRCSRKIYDLFSIILHRLQANPDNLDGEQIAINKLLKESWYNDLNWTLLPNDIFWSPQKIYGDLNELNVPKTILLHHANWTNGVNNKIDQLEYVSKSRPKKTSVWKSKYELVKPMNDRNQKICICLSSLLRNFNSASYSLICRIILSLPSKPDLIGHFPSHCNTRHNNKIINKIKPFCNMVNIVFEDDPNLPDSLTSMTKGMAHQRNGITGNLLQWYSMKRCAELLALQEKQSTYKWVIWSRPDLHFFNSLDNLNNLDDKFFYTCGHDNHLNGVNDRFCLSNPKQVKQRMMIYDYFINEWYPNNIKEKWNAEIVLRDFLEKLNFNIKKINLCFGKLRNEYLCVVPYWPQVHSQDSDISFDHDIINNEVLQKISTFDPLEIDQYSKWHAINILEDGSLFNFISKNPSIESKLLNPNYIKNKNFLFKILKYFV